MTPDPRSEPCLTPAESRVGAGDRVVLRFRDADGSLTDALGDLVTLDEVTAVVRTRRGDVRVPRASVVAAKRVPPPPSRRGRPHRAISETDLQELMVGGMPPLESQWLGRWLLRAADGYTGRGNSALPLGDPGLDVEAALDQVERWYFDREQPALVQVFGPVGFEVADDPVGAALLARGWQTMPRTLVMTAATDDVALALAQVPDDPTTRVADAVDARWISGATVREQQHAATLTAILEGVRDGRYVTIGDGSVPDAVGRLAVSPGWAGVFAVHVQEGLRRQGLARRVLAALVREAQRADAGSLYLQVTADNGPAVALYRSLGFTVHHDYVYAHPTPAEQPPTPVEQRPTPVE